MVACDVQDKERTDWMAQNEARVDEMQVDADVSSYSSPASHVGRRVAATRFVLRRFSRQSARLNCAPLVLQPSLHSPSTQPSSIASLTHVCPSVGSQLQPPAPALHSANPSSRREAPLWPRQYAGRGREDQSLRRGEADRATTVYNAMHEPAPILGHERIGWPAGDVVSCR